MTRRKDERGDFLLILILIALAGSVIIQFWPLFAALAAGLTVQGIVWAVKRPAKRRAALDELRSAAGPVLEDLAAHREPGYLLHLATAIDIVAKTAHPTFALLERSMGITARSARLLMGDLERLAIVEVAPNGRTRSTVAGRQITDLTAEAARAIGRGEPL